MVVVVVKYTDLPGAWMGEGERSAFTGYSAPYRPVSPQATPPDLLTYRREVRPPEEKGFRMRAPWAPALPVRP